MDDLDRAILHRIQADFPLVSRPFGRIAAELGLGEEQVLERVAALRRDGMVRRIGPVLDPRRVGRVGVLVAAAVPEDRLESVAAAVSASSAVTHNYLRAPLHGRCPYNLWFTVSATSEAALAERLAALEQAVGLPLAALPSVRKFKIGVRFSFSGNGNTSAE